MIQTIETYTNGVLVETRTVTIPDEPVDPIDELLTLTLGA